MGYTTRFKGAIAVVPPLNSHEIGYLRRFAGSRRMDRDLGPYFCDVDEEDAAFDDSDVRDYNFPDADQPGLWCKWEPKHDGTAIVWNRAEKFHSAERWMAYLSMTFLAPDAVLARELAAPVGGRYYAPEFEHFTFDHVLNGVIDAKGMEADDVWQLVVTEGVVTVRKGGTASAPVTDTSAAYLRL